jgi:hypothetical protein
MANLYLVTRRVAKEGSVDCIIQVMQDVLLSCMFDSFIKLLLRVISKSFPFFDGLRISVPSSRVLNVSIIRRFQTVKQVLSNNPSLYVSFFLN